MIIFLRIVFFVRILTCNQGNYRYSSMPSKIRIYIFLISTLSEKRGKDTVCILALLKEYNSKGKGINKRHGGDAT